MGSDLNSLERSIISISLLSYQMTSIYDVHTEKRGKRGGVRRKISYNYGRMRMLKRGWELVGWWVKTDAWTSSFQKLCQGNINLLIKA